MMDYVPYFYHDRREAGQMLAQELSRIPIDRDNVVVLGLARGGVPVANEVAKKLMVPLDVMVVRKIGMPGNEEFAVGAIGPYGFHTFTPIASYVSMDLLNHVVVKEQAELTRRESMYRRGFPSLRQVVEGKDIILIDDGIATGSTMLLAINVLRHLRARLVIVGVPVAPADTLSDIRSAADHVVVLQQPHDFGAVGYYYRQFPQTTDDQVISLLQDRGIYR